jgi:hypothetical protein
MAARRLLRFCAVVTLLHIAAAGAGWAQTIPAFSGADGAARNVSGGRSGIVYHVTKLNSAIDDPQRDSFGTIRYGLNNANFPAGVPRTIVFDVGGVFHLGRLPQGAWDPNGNGWDAQSRLTIGGANITLAGQTAPGAGVIFMGGGLKPQGNNNIIRNITVASGYGTRNFYEPDDVAPTPGDFPDSYVYDGMDIAGTNIMIDHVSTVYGTDETISMNEVASNITIQYSNISQGQNYPQGDAEGGGNFTGHALGSLLQAGSNAPISIHHNLYAHLKGRLPRVGSEVGTGAYNDFRNNVFYNWLGTAGQGGGGQPSFNNFVGNYYLAGPGGDDPIGGSNPGVEHENGGTGIFSGNSATRVYHSENVRDIDKNGNAGFGSPLNNSHFGSSSFQANPLWAGGQPTYMGVTDLATVALDRVLAHVGANWWTRNTVIDTIDERIINEVRTGTGRIMAWADDPFNASPTEGLEWRAMKNTPLAARVADWDTEASDGYGVGDGMPTGWELAHGLDPDARDNNGDFDGDGYTNLEEYINEIAQWPAPAPVVFTGATNARYAQITNWDANNHPTFAMPWQPSWFDTAYVKSGVVVVDAVGQHASRLEVAPMAGDVATLSVVGGWIDVADSIALSASGTGTVDHTGGLLITKRVILGGPVGGAATYNFSGGALRADVLTKWDETDQFNFTGGVLSVDLVNMSLLNQGGVIAPGDSAGKTQIEGDLTMSSGALAIELGGAQVGEYDEVFVRGALAAGGTISVSLIDDFAPAAGDAFDILDFGTIGGSFELDLPALAAGLAWDASALFTTGELSVTAATADFDADGDVDGVDFLTWQTGFGLTGPDLEGQGDANGDDAVDELDLAAWRSQYMTSPPGGSGVPEPGGALVAIAACTLVASARRLRRRPW